MNWLDLVIIIALIFFAFEGYKRSFIGECLNFLSFLLALFLSLSYFNLTAGVIEQIFHLPHSLDNVLGFMIVWIVVEATFFALIHFIFKPSKITLKIDKILHHFSLVPSMLRGLIFISIILVVVGTFPIQPTLKQAVYDSMIGSYILKQTTSLETPLKNVFGGITTDSLNFLTVKPDTTETINLGFKTTNFTTRADLENQMIGLVNQERTSRGIPALTFEPKLQQIGREHSVDMFKRGYFSHYTPEGDSVVQRAAQAGISYEVIGENLAYAPDLISAHNGLMNSPGHRANILSADFHKIGIGIMDSKVYGLMITQEFSN